MTVDRECDSPKRGVKAIRKVCQLVGRSDGHGEIKGAWGGVTVIRKCDSHQGGVIGIRKVCQLMKRCNGHGGL